MEKVLIEKLWRIFDISIIVVIALSVTLLVATMLVGIECKICDILVLVMVASVIWVACFGFVLTMIENYK